MTRATSGGLILAALFGLIVIACGGEDAPANKPDVPIPDGVEELLAFIETPHSSATGLRLGERWLLTSAAAVWPAREARVLLHDGTELNDIQVAHWDRMADVALLQIPAGHGVPVLDTQELGSDSSAASLTLVGYEAGARGNPGLRSSGGQSLQVGDWPVVDLGYVEVEPIRGQNQATGVLVTSDGSVVAFLGPHRAKEADVALSISSARLKADELIVGLALPDDTFNYRQIAGTQHDFPIQFDLTDVFEIPFVVHAEAGEPVEVSVTAQREITIAAYDVNGRPVADRQTGDGDMTLSFTSEVEGPFFVVVQQDRLGTTQFEIEATPGIGRLTEGDEGYGDGNGGYFANIDYSRDVDTIGVRATAGTVLAARVESASFDARLTVDLVDEDGRDQMAADDDSGGIWGTGADVSFVAPRDGVYFFSVSTSEPHLTGGYVLALESVPPTEN